MNSDYYINLHFNQAIPQKTGYAFKIGDKGCTFHLHCVDLNPTGMNPHIVFNHSNGTCVEGVPTVSGQDYVYVIQGNEFGVCGQVVVDMKFYDAIGELATQRISTASFTLDVIPDTLTPFDESSSSYADSLEHAREELDDATGDLADMDALFAQTLQDYIDAFGNTAPINPRGEYDPNELYKPRDAVYYTHDGKTVTYMNNLECTGIAPTNTSNWQPIIDIPSLPAVIDSCTSTSTTDALSANQGKVLNDNISAIENVCGSKNMLPHPYTETSKVENGLTFTVNDDGTIIISGTASADTFFIMRSSSDKWQLEPGRYIVSMEGSSNNIVMFINKYSGTTYVSGLALVTGDEEPIEIDYNGYDREDAGLYVLANTVISTPITVKPMIRDSRIVDKTRVPFAMTNKDITKFVLGEGWQIESVAECIPNAGCSFTGIASGDRLRVTRFKNGIKMLSGLITIDDPSLIQNQYLAALPSGYEYKSYASQYNIWTTFVSYNSNPAIVGVINGSQHVVHWFPVPVASGYCVSPTLFY